MLNVMHNDNNTADSPTGMWWDGSNVQFATVLKRADILPYDASRGAGGLTGLSAPNIQRGDPQNRGGNLRR